MSKFVVFDPESGEVTGPFETETEAAEAILKVAQQNSWDDVLELNEKTGLPFMKKDQEFVFISGRADPLRLLTLTDIAELLSEE